MVMGDKVNKSYAEVNYATSIIDNKNEIRVLTSTNVEKNSMLVDIRKYSLYGNMYDDVKRATVKGFKFKLMHLPNIVIGMISIMIVHGMLPPDKGQQMIDILSKNVE